MRRGLSLGGRSREATLGKQLIDQRARFGDLGSQPTKLGCCILLPFEHEALTYEMHVQPITRSKPERRADLGRNY